MNGSIAASNQLFRIQPATSQPKAPPSNAICDMILNKVREQAYIEWLDTTPDENSAFHRAAVEKLSQLLGVKTVGNDMLRESITRQGI